MNTKKIEKSIIVEIEIDSDNPKHCSESCRFFASFEWGVGCTLFSEELDSDDFEFDDFFRCEECLKQI